MYADESLRESVSGQPLDVATNKPSDVIAHHGEILDADPEYNRAGRHSNKLTDDLRKYGNGIE